jgi:hypothetical protein
LAYALAVSLTERKKKKQRTGEEGEEDDMAAVMVHAFVP